MGKGALTMKALKAYYLAKYAFGSSPKYGIFSYQFLHSERMFEYLGTKEAKERLLELWPKQTNKESFVMSGIMEELQILAILHDVIEDVSENISFADLYQFEFPIIEELLLLTRQHNELYTEYIIRVCSSPYARFIKLLDIEDHLKYITASCSGSKDLTHLIPRYLSAENLLQGAGEYDFYG